MNPFELVYDTLVIQAADNPILAKYVKAGNFQVMDSKEFPKPNISPADLPELALVCSNVSGSPIATSSRTEVTVTYVWVLTTGTFDLRRTTSDLLWGLYSCTAAWCAALTPLEWEKKQFVSKVDFQGSELTLTNSENNRGIAGWSASWPLSVQMYFNRDLFRKAI